jgi:hypothetical protein
MLKPLSFDRPPAVRLGDAARGDFFAGGLEYNPPARGVWNIVHTGMLIPETHEIFACAQGCLRGVILTAAEMKALDRMKSAFQAEEYTIVPLLGHPYVEGMNVKAVFVHDEGLEEGTSVIVSVQKPQVNYRGKMIQAATITVGQNIQ